MKHKSVFTVSVSIQQLILSYSSDAWYEELFKQYKNRRDIWTRKVYLYLLLWREKKKKLPCWWPTSCLSMGSFWIYRTSRSKDLTWIHWIYNTWTVLQQVQDHIQCQRPHSHPASLVICQANHSRSVAQSKSEISNHDTRLTYSIQSSHECWDQHTGS